MKKFGIGSHIDSAKYRATMLLQSLEECYHINRQIATNEKNKPKDRIQASETMCFNSYSYL